jgi:glutamine amidotransferase
VREDIKVCILDYGSGNTRSVFNIFHSLQSNTVISNDISDIESATHIILPGVGAFGASMKKIHEQIPIEALEKEVLVKKKPFLGICVGMQVLADIGYEFGEEKGLGWVKGEVRKLEANNLPLPHVGWNNVVVDKVSPITKDFGDNIDFYFVHSFAFTPADKENVIAHCDYGSKFTSVIGKENIFGVQFHPEKSQRAGTLLIKNFLDIQ